MIKFIPITIGIIILNSTIIMSNKSYINQLSIAPFMRYTLAIFCLLLLSYVPINVSSSINPNTETNINYDRAEERRWVDETYNKLSLDERLGQLITVRAYSNKGSSHIGAIENMIRKNKIGGICFFQGTPQKQAELTNRYQRLSSKVPLMISMDAEWGLGMRFKSSTISFPRQLMLGAIQDNRLIYDMGKEVARQCKRIGVHINFAPVVDVNNNPNNPVINDRSFGEDRYNVAAKSFMYMKGMQDNGLLACAKHFPGHGDTDVDSHEALPVINHPRYRLDSIELYPFRVLAQHGIGSMMVAHLNIPSLDNTYQLPSSLSPKIINDLLRHEMGYDGLVFTDALDMAGARKAHKGGDVEANALIAGNDMLLLPQSISASITAIKKAMSNGKLTLVDIETKVKRVLRAKYRMDLHQYASVSTSNISSDLNSTSGKLLKRKLIENAITAVRNKNSLLPLQRINGYKLATVSIGRGAKTTFQRELDFYMKMKHYSVGRDVSSSRSASLVRSLKNQDAVIVSVHRMSKYASKGFGVKASAKRFIEELSKHTQVIVVVFGSPYALKYFDNNQWVVMSYNEDKVTQSVTAQALFGSIRMKGRLPVTASAMSRFGDGINTASLGVFRKTDPQYVGLNPDTLALIDKIAEEAIRVRATPGCQVLVAKDGQVVYQKAYGYHTYNKNTSAKEDDIYDLASVTKICASTISIMKLVDEGKVDLDMPLSTYIPETKGTNKANLTIRDIMAHHAKLKAWIPFYKETVVGKRSKRPSTNIYKKTEQAGFSTPVTDQLFMKDSYKDVVWNKIYASPLRTRSGYKYSDLGFYLMMKVVESVSKQPFTDYVHNTFYKPMGLMTPCFNPLHQFDKYQIPPTEEDKYFRRERIHGHVHDMGAAMLGGVSGHAGLFSNAQDVAAIMQMLLNNGSYGGKQYLSSSTVRKFTNRYFASTRRGIGFDMKELNPSKSQNVSKLASNETFGHLGFTGICTWADPKHNLVYVFLSNRTYPSMNNSKLYKMDFRPRIQSVIYRAMDNRVL